MAREIWRGAADDSFMVRDAASDSEQDLLSAAVSALGTELAAAIDERRLIDGNVARAEIASTVTIAGKSRTARMVFTIENARKE